MDCENSKRTVNIPALQIMLVFPATGTFTVDLVSTLTSLECRLHVFSLLRYCGDGQDYLRYQLLLKST